MSESIEHITYVRQIVSYLETIPNCYTELIEADLPSFNTRTTKVCGGYFPDVYYKDNKLMILGEAKTENDIINAHTYSQLSAYIDELTLFSGERHMVICCSIYALATMKNYVLRIINQYPCLNISFHFIDSLNRIFHYDK